LRIVRSCAVQKSPVKDYALRQMDSLKPQLTPGYERTVKTD